ncbi:MAG: DUF5990 family protein [Flavisolibacter sp.]
MKAEKKLLLKIILDNPPAGIDFGLQQGKGNDYEIVQKNRSDGKDLIFHFHVDLRKDKEGAVDFSGPFVQGPRGERFVYVGSGNHAGQRDSVYSRRLKVPLRNFPEESTWFNLESPSLETKVPGTARDGGPNCATVKPFDGWKLSKNR